MFAMVLVLTEIEEEAAQAYDVATMKYRGINAVTNFDIKNYDVDKIESVESTRLTRKRLKIRKNSTTQNQKEFYYSSKACARKLLEYC